MSKVTSVSEQVRGIVLHKVEQLGECRPVDVWQSLVDERSDLLLRWQGEESQRAMIRRALVDLVNDGRCVRPGRGRYISTAEARRG